MLDFEALRRRMVDNQLRTREVTDHEVLRAFLSVPREAFVAPELQAFAYGDAELRMAESTPGRVMMSPVVLARLVHALPRGPHVKMMIIGCGSGYSAAIASRLAGSVVAVEEDEKLAALAHQNFNALGVQNVDVVGGSLADGCAVHAPYDGILIDGGVEVVAPPLLGQLGPEGVLATVERDGSVSRGTLYENVADAPARWFLFDAWAAVLPGFERPPAFVF